MEKAPEGRKEFSKTDLLGQILVKKGLIRDKELQDALSVQKKEKGLLGDILVRLGYISEEALSIALATQSDLIYIPVEKYKISKDVIKLVPRELVSKYCFLPLEVIEDLLTIVIANPFDNDVVHEIEKVTHCKVSCVIGTKTFITKSISTYYKG